MAYTSSQIVQAVPSPIISNVQSYTPTWGSTGTAPSLGNGTLTGSYQQFGKLVYFRAVLTLGSTSTIGTGQYHLTLHFPEMCHQH